LVICGLQCLQGRRVVRVARIRQYGEVGLGGSLAFGFKLRAGGGQNRMHALLLGRRQIELPEGVQQPPVSIMPPR
jgi:hypothetical protein